MKTGKSPTNQSSIHGTFMRHFVSQLLTIPVDSISCGTKCHLDGGAAMVYCECSAIISVTLRTP